jgi:hypothetical protein
MALVALYFALLHPMPTVWTLDPIALNRRSIKAGFELSGTAFPLTWYHPDGVTNIGAVNIDGAWENDKKGVELPVAILPTNIHPRMSVQRSCFTVQGRCKASLIHQCPDLLLRYDLEPDMASVMLDDLRLLGISHSTVRPDFEWLTDELTELY